MIHELIQMLAIITVCLTIVPVAVITPFLLAFACRR
jgi:hypothetical protein